MQSIFGPVRHGVCVWRADLGMCVSRLQCKAFSGWSGTGSVFGGRGNCVGVEGAIERGCASNQLTHAG
jgi:hypothetical protein